MRLKELRRVRDAVYRVFPERQIFIRADGAVRFFTLSTGVQLTAAAVSAVLLCWVTFTSGTFLFKDAIMRAKDAKLATLSREYESLGHELLSLQLSVISTIEELQEKQFYLKGLIERKSSLDEERSEIPDLPFDAIDESAFSSEIEPDAEHSWLMTGDEEMASATGRDDAPLWNSEWLTASDFSRFGISARAETGREARISDALNFRPGEEQLEETLSATLETIRDRQTKLLEALADQARRSSAPLEKIAAAAGLSADQLLGSLDAPAPGAGGPLVAPSLLSHLQSRMDGEEAKAADGFSAAVAELSRLEGLQSAIASMPLAKPVDHYYISSAFGRRRDPITGAYAVHSGVDMAGRWKEPIHATSDGVVSFVGRHGPYGLMIEIDHGNGFKTRYGHLSKILVAKGQAVTHREKIGLMGSTGRSTGTHLHYEIRFKGKLLNPIKFLRAAEHVSQNEKPGS